jgi:quercetin 2,3-dioxygenase
MLRRIKAQYTAEREDIGDLVTYHPLPTQQVQQIDPFLFLTHHGYQVCPENNRGLPFSAHPHRGFETVTFILKGELIHKDSGGHESNIKAGGVQWMTAGRGLVHEEISSEEFKRLGGGLEILQLWVNLPSKLKMTEPNYQGFQSDEIPSFSADNGKITINLISGAWNGHTGPIKSLTDVHMMTVRFSKGGKTAFSAAPERNIFFYVVSGTLKVNSENVEHHKLIEFTHDGDSIEIEALEDSIILFGHAEPLNEPVISYGPFVMNTREEIYKAITDYQSGKFN